MKSRATLGRSLMNLPLYMIRPIWNVAMDGTCSLSTKLLPTFCRSDCTIQGSGRIAALVEHDAFGAVRDLHALQVLHRFHLAGIEQVLAHDDPAREAVLRPDLTLVGHDPEIHAGRHRVVEPGGR